MKFSPWSTKGLDPETDGENLRPCRSLGDSTNAYFLGKFWRIHDIWEKILLDHFFFPFVSTIHSFSGVNSLLVSWRVLFLSNLPKGRSFIHACLKSTHSNSRELLPQKRLQYAGMLHKDPLSLWELLLSVTRLVEQPWFIGVDFISCLQWFRMQIGSSAEPLRNSATGVIRKSFLSVYTRFREWCPCNIPRPTCQSFKRKVTSYICCLNPHFVELSYI